MTDQQGGAAWESGRASHRLADAIAAGDPDEIRAAGSDLAASAGTAAAAKMASISVMMLQQLAHLTESARQDLDWRTETRLHMDRQFDRLYGEIDGLRAQLAAIDARDQAQWAAGQDAHAAIAERLAASKADRAELREAFAALDARILAYIAQLPMDVRAHYIAVVEEAARRFGMPPPGDDG